MVYTQFHWGDWVRSTQDLTPLERGIYIDLLQRYYEKERAITDDECKRIARAYANAEQEAMQYVLQTFFTRGDGCWQHKRCDEEIAKANSVSEKRASAARKSWASRGLKNGADSQKSDDSAPSAKQVQSKRKANAGQVQSNCSANALLTINHKPITNKEITPLTPLRGETAKPSKTSSSTSVEKPDDVTAQTWADFSAIRKAKRAPITATAINGFRKEAQAAGISLEEALQFSVRQGYQGFKADWYRREERTQNAAPINGAAPKISEDWDSWLR